MPSHIRERVRRYLAAKQRRVGKLLGPPWPNGLRLVFMKAEDGVVAASGHTRAILKPRGLSPLEPYELSPAEEAERQTKLTEKLLAQEPKGTVQ